MTGKPLFIAPRGRTFEDFKKESLNHGWPSFRDEEVSSLSPSMSLFIKMNKYFVIPSAGCVGECALFDGWRGCER